MFAIFQAIPDSVPLPQWARWLVTLVALIVTALTLWRSRTNKLYREERDVYRDKADRLKEENQVLREDNARLNERTDLTLYMTKLDGAISINEKEHAEITRALTAVTEVLSQINQSLTRLNGQ